MIRRLMNLVRGRHPDFRVAQPITSIGIPRHVVEGVAANSTSLSPRRGVTLSPMSIVKADRRAASKRARLDRRVNR